MKIPYVDAVLAQAAIRRGLRTAWHEYADRLAGWEHTFDSRKQFWPTRVDPIYRWDGSRR